MRLTKATLKRLIKEELNEMQGEPSEDDFGLAQMLILKLENRLGFKGEGDDYRKAAEYVRSTLLPTLEMMAEDPERYMDRGMV